MQVGDTYRMYSNAIPSGFDFDIKTESENESIVSVSDSNVMALEEGETKLLLTATGGMKDYVEEVPVYVGKQVTDALTFPTDREYGEIMFVNPPKAMKVGQEIALWGIGLNNTGIPYDMTENSNIINYKSSNPSIASVQFGVVKANAIGTVTITASSIDGKVTKDITINIEEADSLEVEESKVYTPSTIAYTLEGIESAINYAVENGYEKVILPNGTYTLTPRDEAVQLPANMIIDFNHSTLVAEKDNEKIINSTAYTMFKMYDVQNCVLMNGTFYGENYHGTTYHVEHELMLDIYGDCEGSKLINCEFSYAPGFNVYLGHTWLSSTRKSFHLNNIEAGNINNDGTIDDSTITNHFRSKDFISLSTQTELTFSFGCFEGYSGYSYLQSKLYNIYFYDSEYNFISMLKYCVQYEFYERPSNSAYCKIVFFQENAPTSGGDFGIGAIMSFRPLRDFLIKDCTFKYNVSTGLCPQGGENIIIDNCNFIDSGTSDPASAIDWEDGGQMIHSHIVRNCYFENNTVFAKDKCAIRSVKSRNVVIRNCTSNKSYLDIREDTENMRIFKNHLNCDVALYSKTDMIYAGNVQKQEPTIGDVTCTNGTIFVADNSTIL